MREEEDERDLVAGHFTARTRWLLPHYVERSHRASNPGRPVVLHALDPGRCNAGDLLHYEISRIGRRLAHS
ncbi:MAG: hypothetical protein BECKG1743D_GA0114223_1000216 [Candidatus Kentron sp. G]|nr:MAG: hypothetical protein BECKG1743F_GA0114225_1000116 [Candidatus Kentron sp. G]VFM95447.1 MAG: hypothetical protein BECKG1743E_GA0114224_100042 [Candidatus Kentron sp. G]VFM97077.1 MAG: hypothetical protein BECKG1743D_GA0114223_1000216 [Candidatus Kentron sp. G]